MNDRDANDGETKLLLDRVQAGDRQAFEELFARHQDYLHRFIELRLDPKLRARVDASDVVQETQMEAFNRLSDYLERNPMPFRLWLRQTAYERLLKLRRRHLGTARRAVDREIRLPDRSSIMLAQHFLAGGSTPSQRVVRREDADRVDQALADLDEGSREILLMRHLEALSHAEIGCLLGVDEATARKRYGRALLRLRKLLRVGDAQESGS